MYRDDEVVREKMLFTEKTGIKMTAVVATHWSPFSSFSSLSVCMCVYM